MRVLQSLSTESCAHPGVVFEGGQCEVVDVEPDWSTPVRGVVLSVVLVVEGAGAAQRAQPIVGPQLLWVTQLRQHGGQLVAVGRQHAHQQREQTNIPAQHLHVIIVCEN